MSDGTTAVQVSPAPTESEMAHIKGIFERAANAIVGYSELGAKVAELTAKVEALTHEVERVREDNKFLSEQLYETRQSRDQFRQKAEEAEGALNIVRNDLRVANDRIAAKEAEVASLSDNFHRANRESDEHLLRALHAEEELSKVKAKLEDAQAWFDDLKAMIAPPPKQEIVQAPAWPAPEVPEVTEDAADLPRSISGYGY